MPFRTIAVLLLSMPLGLWAQDAPFAQLPLFYNADWVEDASSMFQYTDVAVYAAMQDGCWMVNERYEVAPSQPSRLLQGCYDRDGRLMAFPYRLDELARVKRADPRKARGFDLYSHQRSELEGGNPDPDGGDTLYVYDRDHAHIGTLTVDGNTAVQQLFAARVGQVVLEPHDAVVFMLEEDVYVATAIARQELTSNGQVYWMQAATIWKLDAQTKVFELDHMMDMDGMLNYDSISTTNSAMLDFFHFNEWSVHVVATPAGQRAIIGASARNNSNVFVFELDRANGQTAFALKHVLGRTFPVLSGIVVPFTPTVDDDFPLMLQHGAAIYVDTLSGTVHVAALNNGRAISSPANGQQKQPLSYGIWAIDTAMNTATKLSSHVVKVGQDTLYGQFQGGCEFMPMPDGGPLLIIYTGVDAYFNAQGGLQLTVGDPLMSALIANVSAFRLPPFHSEWEEVFRFKITDMTGNTVNRNLITYVEPHMRPAAIGQPISYGHQPATGKTLVWHDSDACLWRVGTEETVADTLVLDGLWDIATLQSGVELWLPDSMYRWRAERWNTEPVIIAGIAQHGHLAGLRTYPNPMGHQCLVDGPAGHYRLVDAIGATCFSYTATTDLHAYPLDLSGLAAGIYFLLVDGHAVRLVKQ